MIHNVVHIYSANSDDFTKSLNSVISKMQNDGLEVEVQYNTSSCEDGYIQFVVFSALVIGR